MSGWGQLRDFLTEKGVGYTIPRRDLLLAGNLFGLSSNSTDMTRNLLVRAKFFNIVSRGRYQLVRNIPTGTTITELTLLAYGSDNTTLDYLEKVSARKEREKRFDKEVHDTNKCL